jgi:hypothetical protein
MNPKLVLLVVSDPLKELREFLLLREKIDAPLAMDLNVNLLVFIAVVQGKWERRMSDAAVRMLCKTLITCMAMYLSRTGIVGEWWEWVNNDE